MVPEWKKFSPSAYYVYEEPSVTRYDDALDLDFSDITLSAMRKWLQEKYPSLDNLNKQWGTFFKNWEEVVPDDSKEAQKKVIILHGLITGLLWNIHGRGSLSMFRMRCMK